MMNDKTSKWYQILSGGFKVFDFAKLAKEPYHFIILITERGQGKTFNILDFFRSEYLATGKRSVFAYNTLEQFKSSKSRFLSEQQRINPDKWDGVEITKNGLRDKKTKEVFVYFVSVSTPAKYKGARTECSYFVLDEFNEGCKLFRNSQNSNLMSLIMTFSNPTKPGSMKVFIFGNQKTLSASQLLPKLGINSLNQEITIWGGGKYLLWVPKSTNQSWSRINNNWLYDLSEKLEGGYSFTNQPVDNYVNVWKPEQIAVAIKTWTKGEVLLLDGLFLQEWRHHNQIFISQISKPSQHIQIYTFKQVDIEVGVLFFYQIKHNLLAYIANSACFFENQLIKTVIFSCLS